MNSTDPLFVGRCDKSKDVVVKASKRLMMY